VLPLYVQAPFAAFRTFTAGWYRPTAAFLTPSAAYGLAMNIAGIETRRDDGIAPMTLTRYGLPSIRVAIGAVVGPHGDFPSVQTLFQQLHNYPVGSSGKQRKEDARGNKYNITPVRREFLTGLRACVVIDGNPELEARIREGLRSPFPRYGLPFLGDNAFLLDRLEVLDQPREARWYRRLGTEDETDPVPNSTRLTVWIDRQDMSKTLSALYAPTIVPSANIPELAWTHVIPPPEPSTLPGAKKGRKSP
jgi:CRISPR-associated protein Cas5t